MILGVLRKGKVDLCDGPRPVQGVHALNYQLPRQCRPESNDAVCARSVEMSALELELNCPSVPRKI